MHSISSYQIIKLNQSHVIIIPMRALMKGKAAQFFNKKQKVPEDPELVMNNIEAKIIAKYIGIDEQEIIKYSSFFEQVAKLKLPNGYSRYASSDKSKIYYMNQLTGDQDTLHPSIDIIKIGFYQILKDVQAVATFNTKASKLLTFVQEKMIKQCIGLGSKRRDAEKGNMQRDQNGKIVVSKMAKIKPDMKPLLSTRSYMLKSLVEKIYTKREIWGRGKKMQAYAAILAAEKGNKNPEDEEEQEETQESLEQYETIYMESKKFYKIKFGTLRYFPEELKNSKPYVRSTPESVLRNLAILNIEKQRMELYWLARLMECLPMPPGWISKSGDTFQNYFYQPKKILFDLHPSYIYVLEEMNDFKRAYHEMDVLYQSYYNNLREMTFFDFFQRPYTIDLYAYVDKMSQEKMTKKFVAKKSEELGKNDWMALEGIRNSELDIKNAVLIEDILEYWKTLNYKQDNYTPAISPFGEVIWSSNVNQRTIKFCPHAQTLKMLVASKQFELPTINNFKDFKTMESNDEGLKNMYNHVLFDVLPVQREKFLKHYIRHDPQPLSRPYQLQKDAIISQFYNGTFISPFNLECQLEIKESQPPFWLEKVHAKKNTSMFFNLLQQNPNQFQEIKEEFRRYSVRMVQKHEPSRQEDILRVLAEIQDIKELQKFILHVNDLDAREDRKRLAAIGAIDDPDADDNSLGSSISQIEVDDQDQKQQESSEDELIDIEGSKLSSEGKKEEKNLDSDSDDDKNSKQEIIKLQTEEQIWIEEVSEQETVAQPQREKYPGIIYQQDPSLQNISDKQLDSKILDLKKQKLRKHKFNTGLRDMIQRISEQLLSQRYSSKELTDRKKNILVSKFQSEHGPFKVMPRSTLHRDPRASTAVNYAKHESVEYEGFRSEASILGNQEIVPDVEHVIREKIRKREEALKNYKEQKVADETKETIELQPIKRIKPDIYEDARLRHISQLMDIKDFRKTFNKSESPQKQKQKEQSQQERKNKKPSQNSTATTKFNPSRSLSRMQNLKKNLNQLSKNLTPRLEQQLKQSEETGNRKLQHLHRTSTRFIKSQLHSQSHSVLNFRNTTMGHQLNTSPNHTYRNTASKFNRVCLGAMASSLLPTEAVITKGDLIVMEARRSLLSKGRGLETTISKKY